jgi:hypothetical protein
MIQRIRLRRGEKSFFLSVSGVYEMDNELRRRIDEQLARVRKTREAHRGVVDSFVRRMCGFSIDEKFRTVDDAVKALYADTDKNLCHLAVVALSSQWKLDTRSEHIARIRHIATTESDEALRTAALQFLGVIFQGTDDKEIGMILAAAVKNESEHMECRGAAYYGLRYLRGCCDDDFIAFPDSVDWDFVDSFLNLPESCQ